MILFSKVEDSFIIPGRGLTIVPRTPSALDYRPQAGDEIQLRNPRGEVLDTQILSIEFLKPKSGPCQMVFMLPAEIERSVIEAETEIWIKDSNSQPSSPS